jgi:hypothetical protein
VLADEEVNKQQPARCHHGIAAIDAVGGSFTMSYTAAVVTAQQIDVA